MSKRHRATTARLATFLLALSAAAPCQAQSGDVIAPVPDAGLRNFLGHVPLGSHVRVSGAGTRRDGELRDVNVTYLVLRPIAATGLASRPTSLVPIAAVDTVRVLWRSPNGAAQRGAMLLGLSGTIVGLVIRPSTCDANECGVERLSGGLLGFSIGAFVGALAGRAAGTLKGHRAPALWVRTPGRP